MISTSATCDTMRAVLLCDWFSVPRWKYERTRLRRFTALPT